jgi:hypothetical protein
MNATQTVQQTISSLTVNQLTFGTGTGWVQFGPVQASIVSAIQVQAQSAFFNELNVGNTSTVTTIDYFGLFGNYNNTVLAEISTGAGTQELLVFKGSSTSDRVRVQTTGTFVVETGVSARLWNSNTTQTLSNATPAFIINTSSNVGIQTATPATTLDVAGTGRFQLASTLGLNVCTINGQTIAAPIISTVVGLGTVGYISSASLSGLVSTQNLIGLVSTQNLLNLVSTANLAGHVSTPNLLNLVSTANLAGHVSTPNLLNLVSTQNLAGLVSTQNLANLVSTNYLTSQVTSTTIGLGTLGYVSSASLSGLVSTQNLIGLVSTQNLLNLVSTQNLTGLVSTPNLLNLVSTQNLAGHVSTPNLLNLVSTQNLAGHVSTPNLLNLVSTQNLAGLVSTQNLLNLISSPNLISTTAGLERYISSFIDPAELASSIVPFISIPNLLNLVSTSYLATQLNSTTLGLGTIGYVSSTQLASTTFGITSNYSTFLSTTLATYAFPYSGAELYLNYTQTVTPYYQLGINNIVGTNASNVTTVNGNTSNNLIVGFQSDFYIPEFLISGLWTVSLFSQASGTGLSVYASLFQRNPTTTTETLIATSSNSPFIVPQTKVSLDLTFDVAYTTITSGNTLVIKIFANNSGSPSRDLTTFYENGNYSHVATTLGTGAIATNLFQSTVVGLGTLGYVSTLSLVSTTRGLQTSGFISTPNLLNLVSTQNLLNLISSPNLISTTAGLERYISSFIDPAELASSIVPFISTPNLLNLVSTSYLATQLTSTVTGLGTAGYRSTILSSFLTLSTGLLTTSSITFYDSLNANTANLVYVKSTFLYFNNYVVGGATQLQPQIFTF